MRTVTCRDCGSLNPSGSKFCNRCGTSLAQHTHQICPNCQTPNPNDLLYCDNCGTRLSTRKLPEDSSQPSQGEQSTGRPKPFSLPARPPGQTAHLDPKDTLPDWLKTGESANTESEDTTEDEVHTARDRTEQWRAEEAPRLDDVSGSHSPSDDLPLWLMNDDNARDEIFHSEKSIDELFQTAGNQQQEPEQPKTEPVEKPEEELLGSWISDLESEESEFAGTAPEDQIPDWLQQLEEEELAEKPAPIHHDWLANLEMEDDAQEELTGELEEEALPSWLLEEEPESPTKEDAGEELPDWLSGLGQETEAATGTEEREEEFPDWLSGSTTERGADETMSDLPDWLSRLESTRSGTSGWGEQERPEWSEGSARDASPSSPSLEDDEVPDWLSNLEDEEEARFEAAAEEEVSDWILNQEEESGASPPILLEDDWLDSLDDQKEEDNIPEWPEQIEVAQFKPQTPPVPSPETFETPPLPDTVEEDDFADWLADIETETDTEETAPTEGFPDWLSGLDTDDETAILAEASPEVADWLMEQESEREQPVWDSDEEEEVEEESIAPAEGMPDWLQNMATKAGVFSDTSTSDDEMEDFLSSLEVDDLPDWLTDDQGGEASQPKEREVVTPPLPSPRPDKAEEPVLDDVDFGEWEKSFEPDEEILDIFAEADSAYREEMPDYLRDQVTDSVTPEMFSEDELPDWLSDVMLDVEAEDDRSLAEPEESRPSLPTFSSADLSNVPDQLAGEELPPWLEDSMRPSEEAVEPTPIADLPEWLRPGSKPTPSELDSETFSLETEGEWSDILDDLPPFQDPTEQLSEADIPDWLQVLKPQELQTKSTETVSEAAAETSGPLAGLRGVIDLAPVITEIRTSEYVSPVPVSREQQQQVALLRQLVRGEDQDVILVTPEKSPTSPLLRTLLALLLLAAILGGLLAPGLLDLMDLTATPIAEVAGIQEQISQAAGRPVLVAFEYSPALAGALQGQTELLLAELAANDSPVLITSQSATGLMLALQTVEQTEGLESDILGYVPGDAVGLRRLGRCLEAGTNCETITGAPLEGDVRLALDELALIVLLTGERDDLVDWIEQVEAPTQIPLIAGVTEAVAPVAAPYYESGQLEGLLAGLPAVASYQKEAGGRFTALALAHWLVFVILLLGNLYYLLTGQLRSRRRKAS